MAHLFRWIAVPVSGLAVWYAVLFLGLLGIALLDSLCPPEQIVSEHCTAPWHNPAVEVLVLMCTALVAAGIVIVPSLIAPSHRLKVALGSFTLGAAFAVYVAGQGSMWGPFAASAVSGSAALWWMVCRFRKSG